MTSVQFEVSLCDLNSEVGEKLAEQFCTKYGQGKALFCQCDVTDYPQFEGEYYAQWTISSICQPTLTGSTIHHQLG
ncbi:hypothetical protein J6590_072741 [Homalodisca vitripennis]|nr:hypothetical protein J6590_072741 [Homalodisca vitripennis]